MTDKPLEEFDREELIGSALKSLYRIDIAVSEIQDTIHKIKGESCIIENILMGLVNKDMTPEQIKSFESMIDRVHCRVRTKI